MSWIACFYVSSCTFASLFSISFYFCCCDYNNKLGYSVPLPFLIIWTISCFTNGQLELNWLNARKNIFKSKDYTAWKMSVFEVFLVRIFLHSDWIRRDTEYLFVFSPNAGKYSSEKLRIWTLFTHCYHPLIFSTVFNFSVFYWEKENLRFFLSLLEKSRGVNQENSS